MLCCKKLFLDFLQSETVVYKLAYHKQSTLYLDFFYITRSLIQYTTLAESVGVEPTHRYSRCKFSKLVPYRPDHSPVAVLYPKLVLTLHDPRFSRKNGNHRLPAGNFITDPARGAAHKCRFGQIIRKSG